MLQCLLEPGAPSIREILEPFLVTFRRALTLPAELQKGVDPSRRASEGLNPSGSASEDLGHAFRKGQPLPGFRPFCPCQQGQKGRKGSL